MAKILRRKMEKILVQVKHNPFFFKTTANYACLHYFLLQGPTEHSNYSVAKKTLKKTQGKYNFYRLQKQNLNFFCVCSCGSRSGKFSPHFWSEIIQKIRLTRMIKEDELLLNFQELVTIYFVASVFDAVLPRAVLLALIISTGYGLAKI